MRISRWSLGVLLLGLLACSRSTGPSGPVEVGDYVKYVRQASVPGVVLELEVIRADERKL